MRPALIPVSTILAGVQGPYNAVWVKGQFGEDTFYYGRGAGSNPTGVAVVSDMMRVAREIRCGSPSRVSPFAHERLGEYEYEMTLHAPEVATEARWNKRQAPVEQPAPSAA